MSKRVCDENLIGEAISLSTIDDFEEHPSILYMQKYMETLAENGVHQLRKILIIDWDLLHGKHKEHRLTGEAEVEDKVFQILIHLGEKMLEASKIMRKWQTEEYGDASEAGRKVDCLFMFDGTELSNLEIKHPEQKEHPSRPLHSRGTRCDSVKAAYVFMADVCVAERTTSTFVHLPRTAGALEELLESSSLAIIWNFITHLERQGPRIVRAKERSNAALDKVKFSDGLATPRDSTPLPKTRKFKHSVTLMPSKKRNLMASGFFSGHPKFRCTRTVYYTPLR
ncbi:hypothetical protein BGZ47_002588 [Haplosporangium gracile]|nr:hypothetical protein BGZ47_002588 [Haplosporangium gracile]